MKKAIYSLIIVAAATAICVAGDANENPHRCGPSRGNRGGDGHTAW